MSRGWSSLRTSPSPKLGEVVRQAPPSLDHSWLPSPGKEVGVTAQTPALGAGVAEEGTSRAQCLRLQGSWPSAAAQISWVTGGKGEE